MRKVKNRINTPFAVLAVALTFASPLVMSAPITFTGGTVTMNDTTTGVTDNATVFQNVLKYEESGFQLEFSFSGAPSGFASIVGDYYNTSNDVVHWHWDEGDFGEVTEVKISKVDGTTFDLGGFIVSTNTSTGGGFSSGTERVSINTSKANSLFNITPDNWGLGSGPDPLITINPGNTFFDDITWFSFTNDVGSTAVGMGLDNFFLDEPGDPDGEDPTQVPAPATAALLLLGLLGLRSRKV